MRMRMTSYVAMEFHVWNEIDVSARNEVLLKSSMYTSSVRLVASFHFSGIWKQAPSLLDNSGFYHLPAGSTTHQQWIGSNPSRKSSCGCAGIRTQVSPTCSGANQYTSAASTYYTLVKWSSNTWLYRVARNGYGRMQGPILTRTDSVWFGLVFALRPQTPKHIRGGWSHYTDTSEPVDGGVLWTTRTILSV
jgi:hypothetical protein